MSLGRYRKKRRFAETPEPSGAHHGAAPEHIFVVQLHHASHRHYDFRLELDGVLKSWAVPKGPSFDPSVKRLAVEVEDHPIEYADFEGVIPEGNYGAGDVAIFDRGVWRSEEDPHRALQKGHLRFALYGKKLRGRWDLVRTRSDAKKPQWLLRKTPDDEAGPFESDDLLGDPEAQDEPREVVDDEIGIAGAVDAHIGSEAFTPLLALPAHDGERMLAAVAPGRVRLWSSDGTARRSPAVARAVRSLDADALRLDGVVRTEHGRPRYVVFDVLHVDGVDFSRCAVADRRRVLTSLLSRPHDAAIVEASAAAAATAPAVRLTHPERVVYPARGLTKADVFAYYEQIAPHILREIAGRPLALVRCTDGAGGACFFQKHLGPGFGPHVHGAARGGPKADAHVWIDDAAGLLELVQMNVLELHAWGCRVGDLERADRVVFDLDPGPDVAWPRVVAAARLVRRTLEGAGLPAFVRTSGKKGLHVVAALSPARPWDEVRAFARELAMGLVARQPDELVGVMAKHVRPGKIFVDYLRNGRGATSVASYSLRTAPGATVAMPIAWDELGALSGADAFDMKTTLERVARRRRDPWGALG